MRARQRCLHRGARPRGAARARDRADADARPGRCARSAVGRARSAGVPRRHLPGRPVQLRRERQCPRVLGVPLRRRRADRRRLSRRRASASGPPARRRARFHRRPARRRPRRRRAPRAQHRVRVLGHHRDQGVGAGEPHVRAADRGGDPPCRTARVAAARPPHRVVRHRHAGGHPAGDGGSALGWRLRRRARGSAGVRAPGLAAPGPTGARPDPAPARRDPRGERAPRRRRRHAASELTADPRRSVLQSGERGRLRRLPPRDPPKGDGELRLVHHDAARLADTDRPGPPGLPVVDAIRPRPRAGPRDAGPRAHPRRVRAHRRARVRAQRLRDRDPCADAAGARVRGRVPRGRPARRAGGFRTRCPPPSRRRAGVVRVPKRVRPNGVGPTATAGVRSRRPRAGPRAARWAPDSAR